MAADTIVLTLVVRENAQGHLHFFLEHNDVWLDMGDSQDGFKMLANTLGVEYEQVSLDYLLDLVSNEMDGYDESTTSGHVAELGASLNEYLLPKKLRMWLRRIIEGSAGSPCAPVLRICCTAGLDGIPWELVHLEKTFLGLHFQIARMPIVTREEYAPYPDLRTCTISRIYSLLGENVLEGQVLSDWEGTFAFNGAAPFEMVTEERYPSPGRAYPRLKEWQQAIQEADLVHITCYADIQQKVFGGREVRHLFWTLKSGAGADYEIRKAAVDDAGADLRKRQDRPLVFANVCTPPNSNLRVPGFNRAFFAHGVAGYIGTFGLVYKKVAVAFASRFYRKLLLESSGSAPKTIARALWETKTEFQEEWENGEKDWDASYLFYCLYGRPETRFELAH
jgi:hypothetical protein